jgi:hypothetical protein
MTAACSGSRSRRSDERRGTKPCRSVLPPKKEETLLVKLEEITDVWDLHIFLPSNMDPLHFVDGCIFKYFPKLLYFKGKIRKICTIYPQIKILRDNQQMTQ